MKKMFSILLVTLMLLSPFAMCVNAESVTEQAVQVKDTNEQKITSDLQEHLNTIDDDEYVPVYVWLNDYGEDMLYEVLSQRLGKTVTADTEEAYIQEKIEVKEKLLSKGLENLAKTNEYKLQSMSQGVMDIRNLTGNTFKAQANLSGIMTDEEIDTCIESNMTSSEIIELSERNQFLSDYRQSRKTVNTAVNTTFYNSLDLDECRNVYLDPLLCRVTMECKKSYVDDIEKLSVVSQVGVYEDQIFSNDIAQESSNAQYANYHMIFETELPSNAGSGIKVGVLEAVFDGQNNRNQYYDTSAPHLIGKNIDYRPSPSEPGNSRVSAHATKVLSILCGNQVVSQEGVTYQGIVPYATVSLAQIAGSGEFAGAMDWLIITKNVNVVNYSGGTTSSGQYTSYSQMADMYVVDYRISYVNAAGNNSQYVANPALAYNAITVGNFVKYAQENTQSYSGEIKSTSSYQEDSYVSNKPDLAAVGTNIHMVDHNDVVENLGSGTSFAAPQVAGAVALMMQANSYLIERPTTVKAILLNSADEEAISFELNDGVEENGIVMDDPIIYDTSKIQSSTGILREKSGAGLLNIEAAIRMSNSNLYYDFTMGQASTSVMPDTDTTMTTETYYFNAGTTIEFGLVYEKATDELLTDFNFNDLDIRIFDSNDNFVFASSDYINNVEMFKCTFAASGEYKFDIFCYNAESPINATFILSCSCKEKMLTHSNYQLTQHTVSCDAIDGCGFNCYEKHRSISVSKNFGYGTSATFKVYYLFEKGNRQIPTFDYFGISVEDGVSTQGRLWIINPDGMTTSTHPTGETRTYTYYATIELPDGNPVFPTASFVVRIDYFDKTISIE